MSDPREQFERTTCDCEICQVACRTMPGATIPNDIKRIAEYLGVENDETFWREHFEVSSGAVAMKGGVVFNVPSIVPAQRDDGSCVFLQDGRCTVHPVAPFCCSHFDTHMDSVAARPMTEACVRAQIDGHRTNSEWHRIGVYLERAGLLASPLAERKAAFAKAERDMRAKGGVA